MNVYAPLQDVTSPLPVLIWIHGGGFVTGSGDIYDGSALASSKDLPVIVVTFNYRLSALGFLAMDASDASVLNRGIQDQRMLFQFVQRNIHAFGGDPTRVTLAGESAGSMSVLMHTTLKSSWGLFTNVIAESAGANLLPPSAVTVKKSHDFAESLGCRDEACLRALPWDKLVPNELMGESYFIPSFDPRVSGPYQQPQMFDQKLWKPDTNFMLGFNEVEETFFSWYFEGYPIPSLVAPNETFYNQQMRAQVAAFGGSRASDIAVANYPFNQHNATANAYGLGAPLVDLGIYCATQRILSKLAPNAFPYYSTMVGQKSFFSLLGLGATHTSEIPFFFNTGNIFGFNFTAQESVYAETVASRHFLHFIYNGEPMPSWKRGETFVFSVDGAATTPASKNCSIWEPLFEDTH